MNKAKQVVETWDRQFHCAPREQRLAFLYLANDILQNSRRKGAEFVAEFWKVLPDSLRDVIENGDEFGKNAALRLISIWEERKVFGSRGQILKEEFGKKQLDSDNRNGKHAGFKLRSPGGNALDKLISGFQAVYSSQLDEDAIFNKCRNAISFIEKVDKDVEGDYGLGHVNSSITDELKGQHAILRDCMEQLAVVETSRANLVSLLREALQDQVYKLEKVRDQLQAAQTHSEQASTICRQLLGSNSDGQALTERSGNANIPTSQNPQNYIPGASEQSTSVTYTRQLPFAEKSSRTQEDPKSAAAAVAAKLTASTSSAQMLTFVLSSLASEGVIGNSIRDSSTEYPFEKKAKIENEHPSYVPQPNPPPVTSDDQPPPPSSPPPLPPLPPPMQQYPVPQYMQTAMPILSGPYGYNVGQQPQVPPPGYVPVGTGPTDGVSTFAPPSNSYQSYQPESGFYGQPSSLPMAPMSRQ
ncbi:hypothetical protein DH2020_009608 [Rehmannia glutinosa]|uniref:CID domain-containing protein n=1 Tax=Rehmannia glutinosa TaxID=99300 RepID=A0ABR0X7D4_REHGL